MKNGLATVAIAGAVVGGAFLLGSTDAPQEPVVTPQGYEVPIKTYPKNTVADSVEFDIPDDKTEARVTLSRENWPDKGSANIVELHVDLFTQERGWVECAYGATLGGVIKDEKGVTFTELGVACYPLPESRGRKIRAHVVSKEDFDSKFSIEFVPQ